MCQSHQAHQAAAPAATLPWVLALVAGSVALARLAAIALGQAPDPLFATLLAIEIVGVALAAWILRGLAAGTHP